MLQKLKIASQNLKSVQKITLLQSKYIFKKDHSAQVENRITKLEKHTKITLLTLNIQREIYKRKVKNGIGLFV